MYRVCFCFPQDILILSNRDLLKLMLSAELGDEGTRIHRGWMTWTPYEQNTSNSMTYFFYIIFISDILCASYTWLSILTLVLRKQFYVMESLRTKDQKVICLILGKSWLLSFSVAMCVEFNRHVKVIRLLVKSQK